MNISTKRKRQIIDITDEVTKRLPAGKGAVVLFVHHTTAALTTADLDPGTDEDFLEFLSRITPEVTWRHPHDPAHAPDHLLASIIGPSLTIPFEEGILRLGTWQRIVLVELDGPRERMISATILKQ